VTKQTEPKLAETNPVDTKLPRSFRAKPLAQPRGFALNTLALSLSSAMLLPLAVQAEGEVIDLDKLAIEERTIDTNPYAEPGAPYKAKRSADARHKRPIAETAQNLSVLTKAQIEDSGYTDLREILDAQPGITLGTGENGNAFGDRYIIRGQEARSDVFVDSIRDPGMTIRESFATEQVEISKGPSSSFAGRGTAGGAINSVTKQASTEYDFTKLSTALGSDAHMRVTLDANHVLSDSVAVRANVLFASEDVPDRAPADRNRKGLALSTAWSPSDKLDVTFDYYGMRAKDNPDLGGWLEGTVPDRKPARNVPVYVQDPDFLSSDVDVLTARVNYRINPAMHVSNVTRVGTSDNGYVVTGARGGTTNANNPGGVYPTVTLSTHNGWQEVEYVANQTNLHWDKVLGGLKHEFIFGLELTDHKVKNGVYAITNSGQNCSTGNSATLNGWCVVGADGKPVNGINTLMNRQIATGNWDQDWQARSAGLSLMDTVDLSERWTVFGGLRYDHNDMSLRTQNATTQAQTGDYDFDDGMWNGHLGVTFRFRPDANLYFSYAKASDVNGGESDVGTSAGYGGLVTYNGTAAGAEPEVTQNFELGTKWNLFGGKLLATAAAFQITKSDVMEGANYDSVGTFNTGENRVRGIEFGVSGNLTEKLSAQAGATFMKAKVIESATPTHIGKTLSNFADTTAFAQLKYQATPKFAFGGALKYEGKKYAGQPDTAAAYGADGQYSQPVPAYSVLDLFANYRFNKDLDMRVNIGNVTDKDYYLAAYRSGSFLYMGDARNLRVTLNYEF